MKHTTCKTSTNKKYSSTATSVKCVPLLLKDFREMWYKNFKEHILMNTQVKHSILLTCTANILMC